MAQCAATVKKLSLELGGNAPFIVFDDADLDAAVEGAIVSKYRNTGQTCVCANRLLVQDSRLRRVRGEARGRGEEAEAGARPRRRRDAGAAHRRPRGARRSRATSPTRRRKARRCSSAASGTRSAAASSSRPSSPTSRRRWRSRARKRSARSRRCSGSTTEAEAIALANDTEFGLAAYFYGRDIGRIWRVAEALEYGIVGINTGLISTEVAPFGGVKESGIGREGSKYGIEEFLEIKYLCLGGIA